MKEKNIFQKLDLWIERLVRHSGCDQKTPKTQKTSWLTKVVELAHSFLNTLKRPLFVTHPAFCSLCLPMN